MERPLKKVWTRLRGLISLGAIGSAAGSAAGLVWNFIKFRAVIPIEGWERFIEITPYLLGPWALAGAVVGSGFGTLLIVSSSHKRLRELSLPRMALLGGSAGMTVPILSMLYISGADGLVSALQLVASEAAALGGFGAVLGVCLVGVARSAERQELMAIDEVSALLAEGSTADSGGISEA